MLTIFIVVTHLVGVDVRRIDSSFDADFFAVSRLNTRAIVTLGDVDVGVEVVVVMVVLVRTLKDELAVLVVVFMKMRKFYVDVRRLIFSNTAKILLASCTAWGG